jgi:hypothetical protein
MSDTAAQVKYRQEFVKGFEKRESLARRSVLTEAEVNGKSAVFLVADSGGATAQTRGLNGDIPTRPDNLNQFTCTLEEWHDVPERSNFNIYTSQGNGRKIMQMTSIAVMNRKIDEDIHSALATGSQTDTITQSSAAAFLADLLELEAKLSQANAFEDEEPFALITPAFRANLKTIPQFTSSDYVKVPKFEGFSKSRVFNFNGINFIVDSGLPGAGSSTATCFFYVRNAIGHACDKESITTLIGYDQKNDKSWARASAYMGSKLLQNSGVHVITHNDTSIIAS